MQAGNNMDDDYNLSMVEPLTERELEILRLIARGLSNREIAQELVVTLGTVKWYNRQIYSKLGVHSRTEAVAKANKLGLFEAQPETPVRPAITPKHNLPAQVTSFIGREAEVNEVRKLLAFNRLLTLTGPPGTGKTRLALQVAANVLDQFEDGVFFVDLASVSDPQLVPSSITHVLDLQESVRLPLIELINNYLRDKRTLLLLDNFEQILDAAPLVGELLSASSGLKALVTSREVLHVYGEQEYPVSPLPIPDLDCLEPLRILSQYESVELFQQRATAVKPDFRITGENAPAVAEICVRLDGLPLAIELAAARSKLHMPEMIRERLESRLGTLSVGARNVPTRMRTLRDTLDWSYDLLENDEKALFTRLAVFQGGRTVESAEDVCGPGLSIDILDGLESLLNKNLLFQEQKQAGEPRFYMLETVHEYAHEKLDQSGEVEDLHMRHTEYFLALAEHAEQRLFGSRQEYWAARIRDELDNLRVALAWTLEGADIVLGSRLVGALREFWYSEGQIAEGLRWIEEALEREEDIPQALKPKLFNAAGLLSYAKGNLESGKVYHREALELAREMDDKVNLAWSKIFLAGVFMESPEAAKEGIAICEEGLTLFREMDYKPGILRGLNILGELLRLAGDYEQAGIIYLECLALCRLTGNKQREAFMLGNLGFIAMHQGDYQRAETLELEAIALLMELKNKNLFFFLGFIAGPAAALGQPERSVHLLGASEALIESLGVGHQPQDQVEIDRYIAATRQQLDEKTFKRAWNEGRAMSLEQAFAYAVRDEHD
jgi:predicted ATPase/DNA-binding CsgD family transcriptional regulator